MDLEKSTPVPGSCPGMIDDHENGDNGVRNGENDEGNPSKGLLRSSSNASWKSLQNGDQGKCTRKELEDLHKQLIRLKDAIVAGQPAIDAAQRHLGRLPPESVNGHR